MISGFFPNFPVTTFTFMSSILAQTQNLSLASRELHSLVF